MKHVNRNPGFTADYNFKSVPSKMGALIGRDLSPAIFNDAKMKAADLGYYVGDKRTIIKVQPALASVASKLPSGLILFLYCAKGSLTKDEICDFFNKVCTEVPFKLEPDALHMIGTVPYGTDGEEGDMRTYYGFDLSRYEKGGVSAANDVLKKIPEQFERILQDDQELQSVDASLEIAKKSDLEKYFRRNRSGLDKLDGDSSYAVVFVKGGEMDQDGFAQLVNDINDGIGGGMTSDKYTSDDVVAVGQIRKRFPGTGDFEDYDVFAAAIG